MSGAEAIALIGLIDACSGIIKTIFEIGRAVQDAQGLPSKFREVFQRLPTIEDVLKRAKERCKSGGLTEESIKNAQSVFEQCEAALNGIKALFSEVSPKDKPGGRTSKRWFYSTRAVLLGKSGQLEKLLKTIEDNLNLLAEREIFHMSESINVINARLGQLTTASREILPAPSLEIPYRRDPNFVDRKDLTNRLHQNCSGLAGRAALVGLGGVGKSQIAIEYCYRIRENSRETWVLWIYASNPTRYEQSIRDIADLVKLPGREDPKANIYALLRDWLRDARQGSWMIVLDNADNIVFLTEPIGDTSISLFRFLPVCDHGTILITSRDKKAALDLVDQDESKMIEVDVMSEEQALELLEKKFRKKADRTDLIALVATLGYIPLAITQAAAYLNERGVRYSIQQYMDKLQQNNQSISSTFVDSRRDLQTQNAIMLTWQISFEHIRSMRPTASDLLSLMSWCDRLAIPTLLLQAHQANEKTEESEQLDDEFDKDITLLERFSFVSTIEDGFESGFKFEIHRLVQLATQSWLKLEGRQEEWKERFIKNLETVFPDPVYANWGTCRSLYPHTKAAMKLELKSSEAQIRQANIFWLAGAFALARGMLTDSEVLSKRCIDIRTMHCGETDSRTLDGMLLLARTYLESGSLDEAEKLHKKLIEVERRASKMPGLGIHMYMSGLVTTYISQGRYDEAEKLQEEILANGPASSSEKHLSNSSNLALIYLQQGRLKEAERIQKRVMSTATKIFTEPHPEILTFRANLALIYYKQGRQDEAEELQTQMVKDSTEIYGEMHPDTSKHINNLAMTYMTKGNLRRAEELLAKAVKIQTEILGEGHPSTLLSMTHLAVTYSEQGFLQEAERIQLKVIESQKSTLGETHPLTLASLNHVGRTYLQQCRFSEAEELQIKTVEARMETLGEKHPSTLENMDLLAQVYLQQGRLGEAEELYLKVVEAQTELLGEMHPSTLGSKQSVAIVYLKQGRLREAEDLQIRGLEVLTRVLGETHMSTLTIKNNIATIYFEQGRLDEAEKLQLEVIEAQKENLGEIHPATLLSMENLSQIYQKQSRLDEAEEVQMRVIEVRTKILGGTHSITLNSMHMLGKIYESKGDLDQAEQFELRVIEAQVKALGEMHPKTLLSMSLLSTIYRQRSKLDEARDLLMKVIEAQTKVLGDKHPNLLSSLVSLGPLDLAYRERGLLDQSKVLRTKQLDARVKALGETHQQTLESANQLAMIHQAQNRSELAATP